ncbi:MAG TPA: hypothetical protein VLJ39_21745, partial [Tepidisphaeraceae bacterium]|nr:hypothetical protein [Tepidisphaeraceae bacterium]
MSLIAGMAAMLLPSIVQGQATQPAMSGWHADPKLLAELDRKHTAWHYHEQDVPSYALPDPLLCTDGTRVSTAAEWEQKRRPETLQLFRRYVYGFPPPNPAKVSFEIVAEDPHALDGKATLKRVKITSEDGAGKSFSFEAAVLIPNNVGHAVPAFLLINNRAVSSADPTRKTKDGFWPAEEIISRGYATAVFRT